LLFKKEIGQYFKINLMEIVFEGWMWMRTGSGSFPVAELLARNIV
jgi:hypothetical protein